MGKEDYKNEKKGHGFLCVPKELLFDNRYKQLTISQLPTFENLVYYKLDGEEAKRKVFFYYKTHKYKTRVMEEFVRMMHEQI